MKINGRDFTNIEHMAAVDAIRKAGNRILFTVERKAERLVPSQAPPSSLKPDQTSSGSIHLAGQPAIVTVEKVPSPVPPTLIKDAAVTSGAPTPMTSEEASNLRMSTPSPTNIIFPCPQPYKTTPPSAVGLSTFDSMIPSEVKQPSAVVTVTIKQPDAVSKPVPELFPPAPTDLGTVTETITKSTLTETVFTRVTHNEALMVPVQTEVLRILLSLLIATLKASRNVINSGA